MKILKKISLLGNQELFHTTLEEHYNALAVNIQFLGKDVQKILFTSFKENEGKSTVTINIAKALAELGCKVLLLDADTRNSTLLFRLKTEGKLEGLTSYLSGVTSLENIIYPTDVQNLWIIPSGKIPPNPVSLLQTKYFDEMMQVLSQYYDYILVDSPPVSKVIDAVVLSQKCDGSVIVVETGTILRKSVQKIKEELEQAGSKFLGVVLNKVNIKVSSYGEYGKYGTYGK